MRDLKASEIEATSGGFLPLIYVEIITLAAAVDIVYNAGKAFREGYNANDKV